MSGAEASRVFPRPLSRAERELLDWLLDVPLAGRDSLRLQAAVVQVADEWPDGPTVDLVVDRGAAPPAAVVDRVPTEADGRDPYGVLVGVLLHVLDGYLAELEVFSQEGPPVRALPALAALTRSTPPPTA